MQCYEKILYVANEFTEEGEGLKQAATLAAQCGAKLTVMAVFPDLPDELSEYRASYEQELLQEASEKFDTIRQDGDINIDMDKVNFITKTGNPLFIRIIQEVLKENYDLVVKDVAAFDPKRGLRSVDMNLLRKCPGAVWLSRPYIPDNQFKMVVAIDPFPSKPSGKELNTRLLQKGLDISKRLEGELIVLSCWDFEHEDYLRKSVFVRVSEQEIENMVEKTRTEHAEALQDCLETAGLEKEDYTLEQRRGRADDIIPTYITENSIDLLLMGTIARTGVPGFVMGNTAEDVIRQTTCSLLTVKPDDFVSPVKF